MQVAAKSSKIFKKKNQIRKGIKIEEIGKAVLLFFVEKLLLKKERERERRINQLVFCPLALFYFLGWYIMIINKNLIAKHHHFLMNDDDNICQVPFAQISSKTTFKLIKKKKNVRIFFCNQYKEKKMNDNLVI